MKWCVALKRFLLIGRPSEDPCGVAPIRLKAYFPPWYSRPADQLESFMLHQSEVGWDGGLSVDSRSRSLFVVGWEVCAVEHLAPSC